MPCVAIPPGESVLLRMPSFAWSTAMPLESMINPPLEAQ